MLRRIVFINFAFMFIFPACSNGTPAAVSTISATQLPAATVLPTQTQITPTDQSQISPVEFIWSITGEPNGLDTPTDLKADAQGNLYVLDAGNNRIQVFDSDGQFMKLWGKAGSGPGQFNFRRDDGYHIGALTLDRQGNVYIADNANQRIQKFDHEGTFLMEWGSEGTENGQFLSPMAVAVDQEGNVYVADDSRDDIQKFDDTGTFLLKWGGHGPGDGQFNYMGRLALDSENNIYVADFANHRIQKFDSQGTFLTKWGAFGKDQGQFNDPAALAIDPQGYIYVIEYAAHPPETYRVQVFDSEGDFLWTWGGPGKDDGEFLHPLGIAVDSQGNIYVSDETNRIQKFLQPGSIR